MCPGLFLKRWKIFELRIPFRHLKCLCSHVYSYIYSNLWVDWFTDISQVSNKVRKDAYAIKKKSTKWQANGMLIHQVLFFVLRWGNHSHYTFLFIFLRSCCRKLEEHSSTFVEKKIRFKNLKIYRLFLAFIIFVMSHLNISTYLCKLQKFQLFIYPIPQSRAGFDSR